MSIEDLIDFPALQQVEKALWKQGKTRGAAVFVGAGFSRNADLSHEGAALPPLWSDLASAMEARLDNRGDRLRDPLRTAEEFRAVLGQAALEGLIRELVPDDQWTPGALHKKLVALPWVDILTTNWDTLLERASATTLGQTYETVRTLEDISATRQPRVVKLHGTLPSNRPFIVSEEDYRTYPQRFAPYVNLVQQVLLENELCLLGFSGDDPNFLKWSGWVRDQLGVSARRIYLIGALNLGIAQRKLLEQRNVSPIDLSPLVDHLAPSDRHRAATEMFLDRLHTHRPKAAWEWNCHDGLSTTLSWQADPAQVAASLADLATEWALARSAYPGWAVCPPDLREQIKSDTVHALQNRKALRSMSRHDRARLCYEAAWRLDTALLPIGTWETEFAEAVEDVSAWHNAKQRDFLIALLLRNAREDRNETDFKKWETELTQRVASNPESQSWLTYERCLWARDGLDFAELSKLTSTLSGSDPLWGLRRAALNSYLGNFEAARADVEQVIVEARSIFLRDRNSLWALSRFAWAHFCAMPLRRWNEPVIRDDEITSLQLRMHETKCEPWDTISAFDREIEEALQRHQEANRRIQARFKPGTYRDLTKTIRFGDSPDLVNYAMDRLSDHLGVPLGTENSRVLNHRMERTESLAPHESNTDYLRALRIIQTDAPTVLERNFGRIEVAKLAVERLSFLRTTLMRALEYSLERLTRREGWSDRFWSDRVSIYTEILSRLLVREHRSEALEWFHKGILFSRDPRWHHRELFESLEHLLERALSTVPVDDRAALLTDVMEFPLPDEVSFPDDHCQRDWPNSTEWIDMSIMKRPDPDDRVKRRIASFIEMSRSGGTDTRQRAVFWLMQLHISGVLLPSESKEFGDALWSRRGSVAEFPSDTNLRLHMFLLLPTPDGVNARELFKQRNHTGSMAAYIISVAGATHGRTGSTRFQLYDHSEALSWLEKFLNWRPAPTPSIDFEQVGTENELGVRSLGTAIANAILPLLSPNDVSSELAERVFARENDSLSIVQAYPELLRLIPSEEDRAIKGIIRAMVTRQNSTAWAGFNALFRWLRSSQTSVIPRVPRRLIETTVSVVETRREPGLVHALNMAGHLFQAGLLTKDDMDRLTSALGGIYVETSYSTFDPNRDGENTMWTITRAKAARLAGALRSYGIVSIDLDVWLQNAPSDPMPEVRFALGSPFE